MLPIFNLLTLLSPQLLTSLHKHNFTAIKKAASAVYTQTVTTAKGVTLQCGKEKANLSEGLFIWSLNLFSTLEVSTVSQQSAI